jgi:DnaJ-class molecular chaperone
MSTSTACRTCHGAGRMGRLETSAAWFPIAPDWHPGVVPRDTDGAVERLILEPCLVCGGDGASPEHTAKRRCHTCAGHGWLPKGLGMSMMCGACGGTGWVA